MGKEREGYECYHGSCRGRGVGFWEHYLLEVLLIGMNKCRKAFCCQGFHVACCWGI